MMNTFDKLNTKYTPYDKHKILFWILAILVTLVGVSCSVFNAPDKEIPYDYGLPAVGIILEYEVSPDGLQAAVLVPTNAVEPGTEDYLGIITGAGPDKIQILVFDMGSGNVLYRSPVHKDTFENLRWSKDGRELMYMDRDAYKAELVRWQLQDDVIERQSFPHAGFDLSHNGEMIAAWGKQHRAESSNTVTFYSFPDIAFIISVTIPHTTDVAQANWASDDSWLVLWAYESIYKLDARTQKFEELAPQKELIGAQAPSLNYMNQLLATTDSENLRVFDLSLECVVMHVEPRGRRDSFSQAEWDKQSERLYFVLEENASAQQRIVSMDMNTRNLPASCISP